jgi:dihydrofolate synthase / folylpolyglutamate synthase
VPALTYDALVAELFPRLTGGIRWGLDRTRRLLASVGDPHRSYPALHVGGTNGKGSVAAMLAAVLQRSGRRVGLYTSPHLCSFRERFRVDGEPLSETEILAAAERLWPAIEAESPSFFEATTALAFLALASAEIDVAVVEVGLGGRLDATNVIEPVVCVITNVERDHMQYLGDSLESIAVEKAGILKPGVPAVTGETAEVPLAVLVRRAEAVGAPLRVLTPAELRNVQTSAAGTDFLLAESAWGPLSVHTPLPGTHQATNAALAIRALELLPAPLRTGTDAVLDGLAGVRWPGRLQVEHIEGIDWIFDVAHNVAGMNALVAALAAISPARPLVAVVGVLGDKDWQGMLHPLAAAVDQLIVTLPPGAPPERRWDPMAVLEATGLRHAEVCGEFDEALRRAAAAGASVLVTGSFHTVGDALRVLGRLP